MSENPASVEAQALPDQPLSDAELQLAEHLRQVIDASGAQSGLRKIAADHLRQGMPMLGTRLRVCDSRPFTEIANEHRAQLLRDALPSLVRAIEQRDAASTQADWQRLDAVVKDEWARLPKHLVQFVNRVVPDDPPRTSQWL